MYIVMFTTIVFQKNYTINNDLEKFSYCYDKEEVHNLVKKYKLWVKEKGFLFNNLADLLVILGTWKIY